MWQNTKLLAVFSFLILTLGFGFLWFGLRPVREVKPEETSIPSPKIQNSPIATTSATLGISSRGGTSSGWEGEKTFVSEVVDGDTFKIESGGIIRMIGIDTPETKDPRRPVGCFGKEASNETKKLIEGKVIILQKDISETDKYNRLLRYVFLPLENGQILFINDYLVRSGFALVLTYPPDVKYNEQLRQAETAAKESKLGLWGRCLP